LQNSESTDVDYYSYNKVYHLDDCTVCHTDYHNKSHLNPYYSNQTFYGTADANWRFYYSYPWWLNKSYYAQSYTDNGESLSKVRRDFNIRAPERVSPHPHNIIINKPASSSTGKTEKPSQQEKTSGTRVVKRTDNKNTKNADKQPAEDKTSKRKLKKRK